MDWSFFKFYMMTMTVTGGILFLISLSLFGQPKILINQPNYIFPDTIRGDVINGKINIKNIGKVVYLKSSFDGILKRIHDAPNAKQKLAKRPLLKNLDEAKKLYDTRVKEYEEVADFTINVEARDLEDILKELNWSL